jgi:cell wall-associated NlpC family hydrolase
MLRHVLRTTGILLLAVLGACTSAPRYPPAPVEETPVGDAAETVSGKDVVRVAQQWIGVPYCNGGKTRRCVDCSGLALRVYGALGVTLPRMARDQARKGKPVGRSQLKPGDLVFFSARKRDVVVSHVGIYAGRGEIIHASTRSRRVRYDSLNNRYFRNRYVCARRIL